MPPSSTARSASSGDGGGRGTACPSHRQGVVEGVLVRGTCHAAQRLAACGARALPVHSMRQSTKDIPSATPGGTRARSLARKENTKGQDEQKAQQGRASVVLSPADGDRGPSVTSTLGGCNREIIGVQTHNPHLQHDMQRLRCGLTGHGRLGAAGRHPRLQLPQQLWQRAVVLTRPGGPPSPGSNIITVCSLCARRAR